MAYSLLRQMRRVLVRGIPQSKDPDKKPMATVMLGLRMTLEDGRFDVLIPQLNAIDAEWRGYAYEGAGLGFAIFDYMLPWRKRLQQFVNAIEEPYIVSIYIGAGMALGMMRSQRPERFLARQEHVLFRWMVLNGYGFFKGFFSQKRYITGQEVPAHLSTYARSIFDQGVGRSIWFAKRGAIEQVAATIADFPEERQADLWSGAGFACTYSGNALGRQGCEQLWEAAGRYQPHLTTAAALAAHRRYGSKYIPLYTEQACEVFCGLSSERAAQIATDALAGLSQEHNEKAHMLWRERIEAYFAVRAPEKQHAIDNVQ